MTTASDYLYIKIPPFNFYKNGKPEPEDIAVYRARPFVSACKTLLGSVTELLRDRSISKNTQCHQAIVSALQETKEFFILQALLDTLKAYKDGSEPLPNKWTEQSLQGALHRAQSAIGHSDHAQKLNHAIVLCFELSQKIMVDSGDTCLLMVAATLLAMRARTLQYEPVAQSVYDSIGLLRVQDGCLVLRELIRPRDCGQWLDVIEHPSFPTMPGSRWGLFHRALRLPFFDQEKRRSFSFITTHYASSLIRSTMESYTAARQQDATLSEKFIDLDFEDEQNTVARIYNYSWIQDLASDILGHHYYLADRRLLL
ncbi:uncharacterized protein PpBr36_09387 [Pyricularia pennisetigena]|uniref:uncharacterized protein n=1 Tax=Pyricularia pennisetigena TaxID=1578925 RepID=UPI001153B4DF|nr:uncharacterized protein PpBr36_09387 [Pyricularia pennisetigena]TLS21778.1 hypothetical protein PpBr36_09387 [Pyricularia pennisetigena]